MNSGSHTAVVINDHQLVTDLLSQIFKDNGVEIIASFPSVEPGIAYITCNLPILAVVEMMLPVLQTLKGEEVEYTHPFVLQDCQHSFRAVRKIRAECPETRTLMLTGETHPHNCEMGFRAGAHGIASKLDPLADLVDVLRRVMAGESRVLSNRMKIELDKYLMSPVPELTRLEVRILELVQEGLESPAIGRPLGYSAKTIRNRLSAITQKFCTSNRFEATEMAMEMGLVGWRC